MGVNELCDAIVEYARHGLYGGLGAYMADDSKLVVVPTPHQQVGADDLGDVPKVSAKYEVRVVGYNEQWEALKVTVVRSFDDPDAAVEHAKKLAEKLCDKVGSEAMPQRPDLWWWRVEVETVVVMNGEESDEGTIYRFTMNAKPGD